MTKKFDGGVQRTRSARWQAMGSASALAMAMLAVVPATAQEAAEDDEIVVRGIRQSLKNAQDLKREADTFVDAVTAADITALPDRSVAETLQRIPGVAISRFEAADDPDHFSVEGAGVVIRGLTYVRSELNGRDTFSANSGRALGFNDISPELLGSVEVFKQATADMIEGGISGTVNLNTRKPFDDNGRVLAGSIEYNYGDLIEDSGQGFSGVFSDQWSGDYGRFGLLLGYSSNQLLSRADGTQIADYQYFAADGNGDPTGSALNLVDGLPPAGSVLMPLGAGVRTQTFDRERSSFSASMQWESPDEKLLATVEYLRADSTQAWNERVIETGLDQRKPVTPADGTTFNIDSNGTFVSGVLSSVEGWRANNNCAGDTLDPVPCTPLRGIPVIGISRAVERETFTDDFSVNLKWAPTDRFRGNFDVQYVNSTTENVDISLFTNTFADIAIDTTTDVPDVQFSVPAYPNGSTDANYFSNLDRTFYRAAMDHLEDSEGDEFALRADFEYDLDGDFLKSVRFGGRFAERDQTVRWTEYNWGMLSELWNGASSPVYLSDIAPPNGFTFEGYNDYQRGETNLPIGNALPFYAGSIVDDYRSGAFQTFANDVIGITQSRGGFGTWNPDATNGDFSNAFAPADLTDINEKSTALYARVDFGSDDLGNGVTLDGNVGLRYVETEFMSSGSRDVQSVTDAFGAGSIAASCAAAMGTPPIECDLSPARQALVESLLSGATEPFSVENTYDNWLPSLNLKFGLRDDLVLRFGASRSVTRPDLGLTRAYADLQFNRDGLTADINAPLLAGNGGNPFLEPVQSTQLDLALEWYFDDVGSLTAAVFRKDLEDVIVASPSIQPFGGDFAQVEASANAGDGEISGFELAYQQTYDQLPGVWSGLGSQITYTFVDNSGTPNNNLNPTAVSGSQPAPQLNTGSLQGLSDHTINVVGFFENEKLQARLAYNWRSEFLLTTRDVIFPFRPIWHDDTGQLDGSLFYSINDQWKIGVQGVNLLDEVTTTFQQVDDNITLAPRSYFRNDRRYTVALRASF